MPRNAKPLKIWHFEQPFRRANGGLLVKHMYVLSRFGGFTPRELEEAPVVETANKNLRSRFTLFNPKLAARKAVYPFAKLQASIDRHGNVEKLDYDSYFPYPELVLLGEASDKHRLLNKKGGGEGLGTALEVKVYGHLLSKYGGETPVEHFSSIERTAQLVKRGLGESGYTLQQHYDAFRKHAETNAKRQAKG